ncbi:hypothetical protein BGZ60DRAFT_420995 [Tricladium varicosporioides]|nr:hypothetical protein BGZ60DRAFT_420995 [Hymenoscyphus varicosporioides]
MNVSHRHAKTGRWTDYTTGDKWLVVTTTLGYILLAFVGVWLSFAAKHLKKLLANFALYAHLRINKTPLSRSGSPTDETPLLDSQEGGVREVVNIPKVRKPVNALAKIYKEGGGFRDLFWELFNRDLSPGYRFCLFGFILFMSIFMIGFIISGIFLARLKANGPALLDSQQCGLWVFDQARGGDEAATRAGVRDLEKEMRAAEYAQNCYGEPDMFDAIQCSFLYRSRLSFSPARYTTDCPFNNSICGQNQTVTFITDPVHASELGINSPASPMFRRRTSCTPLSMEFPFIQAQTDQNGTTTYYYYYGEKHDPQVNHTYKYTYKTTGDPFDRLAPAYDVFAYTTTATDKEGYWKPRKELTYPEFSTLTLIFVSSLRILYAKRSDDPIFPADKEYFWGEHRRPWFRNSNPRARPLACINYIEVCLGDGKTCWPMNGHIPKDDAGNLVPTPPEFWLMYASLLKTDVFNSIVKRLGRGLLAQSMVSQYFSEALKDDHWVTEVENLVAISHARTQINAWSIASGEDSVHEGKDGYTELTKNKTRYGDLCGIFKYNPPGYASIHFWPFIIVLFSFPILGILSLECFWATRLFETSDVVGVRPQSAAARDAGEERSAPQPDDQTATQPGIATTTTGIHDAPGPSASSSANIPPGDQGGEPHDRDSVESVDIGSTEERPKGKEPERHSPQHSTPPLDERIVSHDLEARRTTAFINDSADIKWEPLLLHVIGWAIGWAIGWVISWVISWIFR